MKRHAFPFALTLLALALGSCSFGPSSSSAQPSTQSSQASISNPDVGDYDLVLSFATTGEKAIREGDAIVGVAGMDYFGGISGGNLYHDNGPVLLGSRSSLGSLSISFDKPRRVSKLVVEAKAYRSDSDVALDCKLGSREVGTLYLNAKASYEYDVSSLNEEVGDLTLSTQYGSSRADIYTISVSFGQVEDIYPESIAFSPASYRVPEGGSRVSTLSFAPSNVNVKEVTYESSDESIAAVDGSGRISGVAQGNATITAKARAKEGFVTATASVEVYESTGMETTEIKQTYEDFAKNNVYGISNCPTHGEPKLLIIPVWFSDSSTFISSNKREDVRNDIAATYLGSKEETGWHSVKSYYEEESLGNLTLNGTVTDWYEVNASYTAYGDADAGGDATSGLVGTATDWYFDRHPGEKRTDYDSDGDGYLDGVMLIYAAPDYAALGSNRYTNLWAYCYWLQDPTQKSTRNPGPNVFFWASYDFMYGGNARARTGKSDFSNGDTSHCTLDAHTFIHEMGHVFGLDDYYDYADNSNSPAATFSMQDYNRGGHDPFSLMAFGWADPYIPESSCEITIGAFQNTHDLILLTPSWNAVDSAFDEYLLLELYTPTGLNELDSTYAYEGARDLKGPTATGLRVWHVDARLVYAVSGAAGSYYTSERCQAENLRLGGNSSAPNLITDVNHSGGVLHAFTNTGDDDDYGTRLGQAYDKYDLLHLIRNSRSKTYSHCTQLTGADLFGDGSSFSMSDFGKQFPNTGKLDSNADLGWSFSVAISGEGDNAQATITLTRG